MNIYNYMYKNNGLLYFKDIMELSIADLDQDQIYNGQKQEIFDKSTSLNPLPVLDFPPKNLKPENNQVIRWDGEKYYLDYDFRGQTVYKKATGESVVIKELGVLSDDLTEKKYPGEFYEWDGDNWVLNQEQKNAATMAANEIQKSTLLIQAKEQIEILQDELDLVLAENEDTTKTLLKSWKTYRVKLNKVNPANPVWPVL